MSSISNYKGLDYNGLQRHLRENRESLKGVNTTTSKGVSLKSAVSPEFTRPASAIGIPDAVEPTRRFDSDVITKAFLAKGKRATGRYDFASYSLQDKDTSLEGMDSKFFNTIRRRFKQAGINNILISSGMRDKAGVARIFSGPSRFGTPRTKHKRAGEGNLGPKGHKAILGMFLDWDKAKSSRFEERAYNALKGDYPNARKLAKYAAKVRQNFAGIRSYHTSGTALDVPMSWLKKNSTKEQRKKLQQLLKKDNISTRSENAGQAFHMRR